MSDHSPREARKSDKRNTARESSERRKRSKSEEKKRKNDQNGKAQAKKPKLKSLIQAKVIDITKPDACKKLEESGAAVLDVASACQGLKSLNPRAKISDDDMEKNEALIAIAEYVKGANASTALPLRHCQTLVIDAIERGTVVQLLSTAEGTAEEEELQLGPLATTGGGLILPLATGAGKTLLSLLLAVLVHVGSMPVNLLDGASTLAEYLYHVVVLQRGVGDRVHDCVRAKNRAAPLYKTKTGKVRMMETSIFCGYNVQPAETFAGCLLNLVAALRDERMSRRLHRDVRMLVQKKAEERLRESVEIEIGWNERKFLAQAFLSGSVGIRITSGPSSGEVHVFKLGLELYSLLCDAKVGGSSADLPDILKVYPSMADTVLIDKIPYTPLAWILSRTATFWGSGRDKWKPMFPSTHDGSINSTIEDAHKTVLLIASVPSMRKPWDKLSRERWGKAIRDEADVANSEVKKTFEFFERLDAVVPTRFNLSGTIDVQSTPQVISRNILGSAYPFGFGLRDSVKNGYSSLPAIERYKVHGNANGNEHQSTSACFAALSHHNSELTTRAWFKPGPSEKETAVLRAMCQSIPYVGTVSFPKSSHVEHFKKSAVEYLRAKSEDDFPDGPRKELYHIFNKNGRGMFAGRLDSLGGGEWEDQAYVPLATDQVPIIPQRLVPLIDLQDQLMSWDDDLQDWKEHKAQDGSRPSAEKMLSAGPYNLLIVIHKNVRGFNVPLMSHFVAIRNHGVAENTFVQMLGRLTRNPDRAQITNHWAVQQWRLPAYREKQEADVTTYLAGTGHPWRKLLKFISVCDDPEHLLIAAEGLARNGLDAEMIGDMMGLRFVHCARCKLPLEQSSPVNEELVLTCKGAKQCATFELPCYAKCFERVSGPLRPAEHMPDPPRPAEYMPRPLRPAEQMPGPLPPAAPRSFPDDDASTIDSDTDMRCASKSTVYDFRDDCDDSHVSDERSYGDESQDGKSCAVDDDDCSVSDISDEEDEAAEWKPNKIDKFSDGSDVSDLSDDSDSDCDNGSDTASRASVAASRASDTASHASHAASRASDTPSHASDTPSLASDDSKAAVIIPKETVGSRKRPQRKFSSPQLVSIAADETVNIKEGTTHDVKCKGCRRPCSVVSTLGLRSRGGIEKVLWELTNEGVEHTLVRGEKWVSGDEIVGVRICQKDESFVDIKKDKPLSKKTVVLCLVCSTPPPANDSLREASKHELPVVGHCNYCDSALKVWPIDLENNCALGKPKDPQQNSESVRVEAVASFLDGPANANLRLVCDSNGMYMLRAVSVQKAYLCFECTKARKSAPPRVETTSPSKFSTVHVIRTEEQRKVTCKREKRRIQNTSRSKLLLAPQLSRESRPPQANPIFQSLPRGLQDLLEGVEMLGEGGAFDVECIMSENDYSLILAISYLRDVNSALARHPLRQADASKGFGSELFASQAFLAWREFDRGVVDHHAGLQVSDVSSTWKNWTLTSPPTGSETHSGWAAFLSFIRRELCE